MDDGIFGKDDSEAEILRLERPATRSNWMTPDGTAFDLTIPPTVYPPREDTDLLCQTLRGLGPGKGQRLLEIGCGSGAVSLYAASLGYRVRACDINPYAVAATKANAQHLRHDLDVHEGGPGPRSDGSVEQWSGTQPHDVVVWNLPYLNHDPTVEEVLGPLEEAALLDTDDKGLVSRLMTQVSENQLISKNGIILLLVSGNEKMALLLDVFRSMRSKREMVYAPLQSGIHTPLHPPTGLNPSLRQINLLLNKVARSAICSPHCSKPLVAVVAAGRGPAKNRALLAHGR